MFEFDPRDLPFLFFGGLALIIVGGLLLKRRMERKRTEAMRQFAGRRGCSFSEKGNSEDFSDPRLMFYRGLRSLKIYNVMRWTSSEGDAAVFDQRYTQGKGKNSHTHTHTVAAFRSRRLDLPGLSLSPESGVLRSVFLRGLLEKFGFHDINFDSHPAFSDAYALRGDDEASVRAAFTDAVLSFFESRKGLRVEGGGQSLLVFKHLSRRVRPEDLSALIEEADAVFAAFRRR